MATILAAIPVWKVRMFLNEFFMGFIVVWWIIT